MLRVTKKIEELIDRGALFVLNNSAGKDSQAMSILIRDLVPDDQLLVIHAQLVGADWSSLIEHIEENCQGLPLKICSGVWKDGTLKTFDGIVRNRGKFPAMKFRQCTSDLKTGPIWKVIRQHVKEIGHSGLIVNCVGIRAEESAARKKMKPFKSLPQHSKAGRECYEWFPIHHLKEAEVFAVIKQAGQKPHWVYAAGMRRLSCIFCIFCSPEDLKTAAGLAPERYREVSDLEVEVNHTLIIPKSGEAPQRLSQIVGIDPWADSEAA